MTAILRIASSEIRSLFYSPIAWLLLIVFCIQASMLYLSGVGGHGGIGHVAAREVFESNEFYPITFSIFADPNTGMFTNLLQYLLLYVPLLTMGLLARELHSGSIKLLQSSPVTLGQIVMGKYLAMMAYFGLFVLYLLFLMGLAGIFIVNFQYLLVLSGIAGIYLLCCAYAAVGLFMSSLTRHQVVAAVSTLALLAVLGFIGTLGQRIPFVADIAYWLSISGRAEYMLVGLIASKDVCYFLAIIALFLSFTYLKLAAGRASESRLVMWGRAAGVSAVILGFGFVTSLPALTFYKDTTHNKMMTIAPESQTAMAEIEGPWGITAYVNVLDEQAQIFMPAQRNRLERSIFDPFIRKNPKVEVDYIFYYAPSENASLYENNPGKTDEELARQWAYQHRMNFKRILPRKDVHAPIDLEAESYRPLFVVSWQDRVEVVRTFRDSRFFASEKELATGLKRLTNEDVAVAYVTGQGERSLQIRGGQSHQYAAVDTRNRRALVNRGFDVEAIRLSRPVPEAVDILVVAAPVEVYAPQEARNLAAYIAAGRDLLIMVEPGTQDVANPLLEPLGVTLRDGQVFEVGGEFSEDMVFAPFASFEAGYVFDMGKGISDTRVALTGVGILDYRENTGFEVTPLVSTKSGTMVLRDAIGERPAEGHPALALERTVDGVQQRVVVVADADFASAATLTSQDIWPFWNNNHHLFARSFRFFSDGEYPLETFRGYPIDNHIALELHQVDYFKIALYGVLPTTIFLMGAGLLAYRRRY